MKIQDLLQITIDKNASDLHLISDYPSMLRVDGELVPIDHTPLTGEQIEKLVTPLLNEEQLKVLMTNRELDFSFGLGSGRFRINLYFEKGAMAGAFRLIPLKIKSIDELGLPTICHEFAKLKQGFVLVTGPTGHGKSTTIAAIIEEINLKIGGHILTIEDPIEYVYSNAKAIVSQREVGGDTFSWSNALRSALREDPNIVLVGEMRDYETIAAAITIAETGHLVFATLHTNSAAQTMDRIIDVFPENQQAQVRMQLSNALEAVISQRLIPTIGGGRAVAAELLVATPAVKSIVRDGKSHLIDNVIQTSADMGMMTMDMSIARLVQNGKLSFDTAVAYASSPDYLRELVKKRI